MTRRAALALALLLTGCVGSPRTHFFTLDPVPPGSPPPQAARGPAKPIVVGRVQLPPALDRDSLVTRSGPVQINVSDQNRWAAPLDGIIQRTLAADLAARMPHGQVIMPGDPVPPRARTLTVDVQDFMADTDGRVHLNARWTLNAGTPPRPEVSERETIEEAAPPRDTAAAVAAMSRALGAFADRIAARLTQE